MILGHAIPRLFYEGYVYDGYLYTLALQLIEDARHIDPVVLTIEEKEIIIKQSNKKKEKQRHLPFTVKNYNNQKSKKRKL